MTPVAFASSGADTIINSRYNFFALPSLKCLGLQCSIRILRPTLDFHFRHSLFENVFLSSTSPEFWDLTPFRKHFILIIWRRISRPQPIKAAKIMTSVVGPWWPIHEPRTSVLRSAVNGSSIAISWVDQPHLIRPGTMMIIPHKERLRNYICNFQVIFFKIERRRRRRRWRKIFICPLPRLSPGIFSKALFRQRKIIYCNWPLYCLINLFLSVCLVVSLLTVR